MQDVDFAHGLLMICDAKGGVSRRTVVPECLLDPLHVQIAKVRNKRCSKVRQVRQLYEEDLAAGHGLASVVPALYRKFAGAVGMLAWQHVFPAARRVDLGAPANAAGPGPPGRVRPVR